MDKRFNALRIMADQLTAAALRMYGNKVCRTPHIDSLLRNRLDKYFPVRN